MTTLEDLWYGNIRPVENYVEGNVEYKSLLRLVSKNRETLESELSKNQIELYLYQYYDQGSLSCFLLHRNPYHEKLEALL